MRTILAVIGLLATGSLAYAVEPGWEGRHPDYITISQMDGATYRVCVNMIRGEVCTDVIGADAANATAYELGDFEMPEWPPIPRPNPRR